MCLYFKNPFIIFYFPKSIAQRHVVATVHDKQAGFIYILKMLHWSNSQLSRCFLLFVCFFETVFPFVLDYCGFICISEDCIYLIVTPTWFIKEAISFTDVKDHCMFPLAYCATWKAFPSKQSNKMLGVGGEKWVTGLDTVQEVCRAYVHIRYYRQQFMQFQLYCWQTTSAQLETHWTIQYTLTWCWETNYMLFLKGLWYQTGKQKSVLITKCLI